VRATQMPILLEDDQFVGRLNYYKMSSTPDKVYGGSIGSSYQQQGLALSKQFKREDQYISGSAAIAPIIGNAEAVESDDEDDDSLLSLAFPGNSVERLINAKKT